MTTVPCSVATVDYPGAGVPCSVAGADYPGTGVPHPVAGVPPSVAGADYPVAGVAHPVAGVPRSVAGAHYPVAGVPHPVAGVLYLFTTVCSICVCIYPQMTFTYLLTYFYFNFHKLRITNLLNQSIFSVLNMCTVYMFTDCVCSYTYIHTY